METIIKDFLTTEFPVNKIRNYRKKWVRAIIIPQGYVRSNTENYLLDKSLITKSVMAADIIKILCNVFGCSYNLSKEITLEYFQQIRI